MQQEVEYLVQSYQRGVEFGERWCVTVEEARDWAKHFRSEGADHTTIKPVIDGVRQEEVN